MPRVLLEILMRLCFIGSCSEKSLEIFGYACLILADKKTVERPVSVRLHEKLDKIVRSRDKETIITLEILLDGFIKKLTTSSQGQLREPQE